MNEQLLVQILEQIVVFLEHHISTTPVAAMSTPHAAKIGRLVEQLKAEMAKSTC